MTSVSDLFSDIALARQVRRAALQRSKGGSYPDDEELLQELYKSNYSAESALHRCFIRRLPQLSSSTTWHYLEVGRFEAGYMQYRKNFRKVQRIVQSRSLREVVAFYYIWKRSPGRDRIAPKGGWPQLNYNVMDAIIDHKEMFPVDGGDSASMQQQPYLSHHRHPSTHYLNPHHHSHHHSRQYQQHPAEHHRGGGNFVMRQSRTVLDSNAAAIAAAQQTRYVTSTVAGGMSSATAPKFFGFLPGRADASVLPAASSSSSNSAAQQEHYRRSSQAPTIIARSLKHPTVDPSGSLADCFRDTDSSTLSRHAGAGGGCSSQASQQRRSSTATAGQPRRVFFSNPSASSSFTAGRPGFFRQNMPSSAGGRNSGAANATDTTGTALEAPTTAARVMLDSSTQRR